MIIILWIICLILFSAATTLFFFLLFSHQGIPQALQNLIHELKQGLKRGRPLSPQSRYPIELWIWEATADNDVCEDCLERALWPPMDIADWMREGHPRTPESETECGDGCRCRLVPYNPKKFSKRQKYR